MRESFLSMFEKKQGNGWNRGDVEVWMAFIPYGKTNWAIRRGMLAEVAANDYWQPYDPEHPEPPAPPEEVKLWVNQK